MHISLHNIVHTDRFKQKPVLLHGEKADFIRQNKCRITVVNSKRKDLKKHPIWFWWGAKIDLPYVNSVDTFYTIHLIESLIINYSLLLLLSPFHEWQKYVKLLTLLGIRRYVYFLGWNSSTEWLQLSERYQWKSHGNNYRFVPSHCWHNVMTLFPYREKQ